MSEIKARTALFVSTVVESPFCSVGALEQQGHDGGFSITAQTALKVCDIVSFIE